MRSFLAAYNLQQAMKSLVPDPVEEDAREVVPTTFDVYTQECDEEQRPLFAREGAAQIVGIPSAAPVSSPPWQRFRFENGDEVVHRGHITMDDSGWRHADRVFSPKRALAYFRWSLQKSEQAAKIWWSTVLYLKPGTPHDHDFSDDMARCSKCGASRP